MNYDDEEDDDPNDPSHRDYDLSEAVIHVHDEYDGKPWFLRRGVLLVVAGLLLFGLVLLPVLSLL